MKKAALLFTLLYSLYSGQSLGYQGATKLKQVAALDYVAQANNYSAVSLITQKIAQHPMKMAVETPANGATLKGNVQLKGWAISSGGIKGVEVLKADNSIIGTAEYGQSRPDILKQFPGYTNGAQSGFSFNLETAKLPDGEQVIRVKATANKGEVQTVDLTVKVNNAPPVSISKGAPRAKNSGSSEDPRITLTWNKLLEIINSVVRPGMSDEQVVRAFHDYIVTHARYDVENLEKGTLTSDDFGAYGILVKGTGVCQGYAASLYLLLDMVGIENKMIYGEAFDGQSWQKHAWNLVKIGGSYYHVDVTWDDPDQGDSIEHDYFKVTDVQISKNHRWNQSLYPKSGQ